MNTFVDESDLASSQFERGPLSMVDNGPPVDGIDPDLKPTDEYLSTKRKIQDAKGLLREEITQIVDHLLRSSRTLGTNQPLWRDILQQPFLFDTMSKVYGTTTNEELLEALFTKPATSSLNLSLTLKVILAATVSRWVLEGRNDLILKDPTERDEGKNRTEEYFAASR